MAGPSFNQIMMLAGLGVAGVVAYELWINQSSISAAIQNALNPVNPYQQQGYYCPMGGVPSPQGLCPNGQPAINQSQFNQIASMTGGCSDGSIVNPSTGRCANGSFPMQGYGQPGYGYGQGGLGYPQTSVCNDGSQPNPYNGLCANGSVPTSVGTGVPNAMVSPYGAPSSVYPTIAGGVGVPGGTTFTDPTTGQMYDPTTGMLLTPGGSYTTPSLASPYSSIFPILSPLRGGGFDQTLPPGTGGTGAGAGTMGCVDGSTPTGGLCANGQQPTTMLPAGTVTTPSGAVPTTVVTQNPTPTPSQPVTPSPSTQPITQTAPPTPSPAPGTTTTTTTITPKPLVTTGAQPGAPGAHAYVGYQTEGSMIAGQAQGYIPRDRSRASVTNYSSVRPRRGDSPITAEVFGRRFFTQQPIYVSGIR